jgi:hypothetical protein
LILKKFFKPQANRSRGGARGRIDDDRSDWP